MIDFLITLGLFYLTLSLLPLLGVCYLVVNSWHSIWLFVISLIHTDVEFLRTTTVRTLLDTHRNQGIIALLLSVKGKAQPEAVRRHLNELVRRRDKSGNLTNPRLRHCLVTRCGTYAWQRTKFDLDQNLIVAPVMYKRRAVTEYNIQEYVSDMVSKYLPNNLPPWQMIIIPSSEDQHYILLKLHHVLLSDGLNIGDMLPLIPPTRQFTGVMTKSPLVGVVREPAAILELKERFQEELTNRWNEFVANYDPLECTELLKNNPGLFQYQAIILITLISTIREYKKGLNLIKNDLLSKLRFLLLTIRKECKKRKITIERLLLSALVTIDPRNLLKLTWKIIEWFLVLPWKIFVVIYREIFAFYNCLIAKYCLYQQTIVGTLYDYVPLIYRSIRELIYYSNQLIISPRIILNEILLQKESFQTITLCGRKSVAWSHPIKIDLIKQISQKTNCNELEIMLTTISTTMSRYLQQTKHLLPDTLPITLRNINTNYLFAIGPNIQPLDAVSGILCMNLPILYQDKHIIENLIDVRVNFRKSIEQQSVPFYLTKLQTKYGLFTKTLPSSILSIYLRYLSRKYAISVTEITTKYPNVKQRTIWGQEVNNVIYWRPPQANSSISLCLNEYADHVRLGVMCDSQLVPHHSILVREFPEFVQNLARSVGINA